MTHWLIIKKAEAFKGIHSWNISQGGHFLAPYVGTGICLAASCYYMSMHKRGSSLREGLGLQQGNNNLFAQLNEDSIKFLRSQQICFGSRTDSSTFKKWLDTESKLKRKGYGGGELTMAKLLASIRGILPSGGYMMLIVAPAEESKHAVVAYFGARRNNRVPVRFFDINVGEFLFRDHVRFLFFFDWLLRCVYANNQPATYEFQHFL